MLNKNNSIRDDIRRFDPRYADIYRSAAANGTPIPVVAANGKVYIPATPEERIAAGIFTVQRFDVEPSSSGNLTDFIEEDNIVSDEPVSTGGINITPVTTYAEIPDPLTLVSGKSYYLVVNDPNQLLNGLHYAGGANIGQPALNINKV